MDVRAFGSIYGQTASLPFASGFVVNASGTSAVFPACRGFYIETSTKTADKSLIVTLADAPSTPVTFTNIRSDGFMPISITAISGASTVDRVFVFY